MHSFLLLVVLATPSMCCQGDCLAKLWRHFLRKPTKSLNTLTPAANAALTSNGNALPQTSAHLHRLGLWEKVTVWHCLKNRECPKHMFFSEIPWTFFLHNKKYITNLPVLTQTNNRPIPCAKMQTPWGQATRAPIRGTVKNCSTACHP